MLAIDHCIEAFRTRRDVVDRLLFQPFVAQLPGLSHQSGPAKSRKMIIDLLGPVRVGIADFLVKMGFTADLRRLVGTDSKNQRY